MTTLAERRLSLGAAAILSVTQAAELLPFRRKWSLRWLRRIGVVRPVFLEDPDTGEEVAQEVVVWGDVLAALGADLAPAETKAPLDLSKFRRGL